MRTLARRLLPLAAAGATLAFVFAGPSTATSPAQSTAAAAAADSPIDHVVIIYLENHSFDNIFGRFCYQNPLRRCEGAITGTMPDGSTRPLTRQPDWVNETGHTGWEQIAAINKGQMNGWPAVRGCGPTKEPGHPNSLPYGCYTQLTNPTKQIPNLMALARKYALSDRTFQLDSVPSWQPT